jgi:hypothetical protein
VLDHRFGQRHRGPEAAGHLGEQQRQLEAGQVRPDAEVRPVAEGDVGVGTAGDVEPERVDEDVLVPVGRRVQEDDPVPLDRKSVV